MKYIKEAKNNIFGDTNQISSERYFLTVTTAVVSMFLFAICLVHIYIGLKIAPVFLACSASLIMLVLYYFIRFKNCLLFPKIILTVGGLILLDLTWYSKFLSSGPVLFFILIFIALAIWVWEGKQLLLLIFFYFVNLAVLFYIEYNAPELLFKYPDSGTRSIDVFLSFFLYSILLISLMYLFKKEFIRQKRKEIEANKLYSGLFVNTTIGLYQTTPDGKVLTANRALLKMLNFNSLEELLQRDITKDSYVDINKRTVFQKTIEETGEINDYESEWYCRNGGIVVVLESAKGVRNSNGEIIRYDGTVQDITEKRKIERELILSKEKAEESDRLKSAFLANMSHEIRTPMNGILGFSDLLKDPGLTGDEQQKYIEIIEKSGERMLNILNDIVDISKIEAGLMELVMKKTNVNEQIEYTYTFFKPEAEKRGLELSYNIPCAAIGANIITDREKLYAILTNLVKNALKYTEKGSIELGYYLKTSNETDELEFYVKDTGVGIPKDRQEAIFERFIQVDIADKMARQGAGLGLAITKAYVEMLGGKIRVESNPEGNSRANLPAGLPDEKHGKFGGSIFYFTLPYNTEPNAEEERQINASEDGGTLKKLKILIAENDEISELLLIETIKMFGKEVLIARTGVEAVELCRANPNIDLILMDIRMPKMNGYQATNLIREFNKEVIIIAQTAYGLTGDRGKAIESGCNDYIAKPIIKMELQALIQKYFRK